MLFKYLHNFKSILQIICICQHKQIETELGYLKLCQVNYSQVEFVGNFPICQDVFCLTRFKTTLQLKHIWTSDVPRGVNSYFCCTYRVSQNKRPLVPLNVGLKVVYFETPYITLGIRVVREKKVLWSLKFRGRNWTTAFIFHLLRFLIL